MFFFASHRALLCPKTQRASSQEVPVVFLLLSTGKLLINRLHTHQTWDICLKMFILNALQRHQPGLNMLSYERRISPIQDCHLNKTSPTACVDVAFVLTSRKCGPDPSCESCNLTHQLTNIVPCLSTVPVVLQWRAVLFLCDSYIDTHTHTHTYTAHSLVVSALMVMI